MKTGYSLACLTSSVLGFNELPNNCAQFALSAFMTTDIVLIVVVHVLESK